MNGDLTQGPIRKHLLQMAIPMSTGMFFNTMFNVVDTFFAGQLGTPSLAGMSASFSVFFILTAISSGIGTGLAALLSNAIGRRDEEQARLLRINGLVLAFLLGVILTVLGVLFSPQLLYLLGARDEALAEGSRYVRGIYAGSVFFAVNSSLNAFLTSQGLTKPYRNFLILGFFLNLILDPLFIYGWLGLPKMGTMGVAMATVVIQVVGSVYLFWKVRSILGITYSFKALKALSLPRQFEILAQGVPASLNMLTIAIGIFVINYYVYRFGSDASTAGYGAAMRVEQLVLLPAIGLNAATLTLVGQNHGAGKPERVRESFCTAIKIGLAIMTAGMIIIYPLAPFLIGLFNNDPQVIFEGARYLRIEFIAFNGYIIINISLSLLQGLKKPHYAIWLGLYRQLAMPLILFNLLGQTLGLGLPGIWWGIVITVWTGALGSWIIANRELKKITGTAAEAIATKSIL